MIRLSSLKVGDKVVANRLADACYAITRNNWIGQITKINYWQNTFSARGVRCGNLWHELDPACFDLYEEKYTKKLERVLKFEKEV